jgi:osmotically-inducible protein OsmY
LLAVVLAGAGCAGDRYSRSTGQVIDDRTLAARVNQSLDDNAEYKFSSVDVKVYRGTVQLSGFVNTRDQKNRAGEIAEAVPGVDRVENNLTIKPESPSR